MELSRTATRLFFVAAFNLAIALYSVFLNNWLISVLVLLNFFVILLSFAEVENAIDEMRYNLVPEEKSKK